MVILIFFHIFCRIHGKEMFSNQQHAFVVSVLTVLIFVLACVCGFGGGVRVGGVGVTCGLRYNLCDG